MGGYQCADLRHAAGVSYAASARQAILVMVAWRPRAEPSPSDSMLSLIISDLNERGQFFRGNIPSPSTVSGPDAHEAERALLFPRARGVSSLVTHIPARHMRCLTPRA